MTDVFVKNYTPLNDQQKEDVSVIKSNAQELLNSIQAAHYADRRMLHIAKERLEEAVMWAVKGVTNPIPAVDD